MSLWIRDSGASTAEIERGVAAAKALLAERGITPEQAHSASLAEAEGAEHDASHAQAWYDAEREALDECFAGWMRVPERATLTLD